VVEPYTELLGARGQDHCMVRVYVRDGTPVGGIPVTEHFEVNLVPLNINIKQSFVDAMTAFMFPAEDSAAAAVAAGHADGSGDDIAARSSNVSLSAGGPARHRGADSTPAVSSAVGATGDSGPVPPPRSKRSQLQHMFVHDEEDGAHRAVKHQPSRSDGTHDIVLDAPVSAERRASLDAMRPLLDTFTGPSHRRSKSSDLAEALALASGADEGGLAISPSVSPSQVELRGKKPGHRQHGHRRSVSQLDSARSARARPHSTYEDDGRIFSSIHDAGTPTSASARDFLSPMPSSSSVTSRDGRCGGEDAVGSTDPGEKTSRTGSEGPGGELAQRKSPELRRRGSVTRLINRARETSKRHTAEVQVATMRSRSQDHRTYICFKVPSFTVRVSYRRKEGDKTTLRDLNNFAIKLPLLEYRNRTCTVKGLIDLVRADCVGHVISAVLKTKVLGMNTAEKAESKAHNMDALTEGGAAAREEILFGSEKSKDKWLKKSEMAKKKQEKKDEKARKKTDSSDPNARPRSLFW
jgi:hypothetical protein